MKISEYLLEWHKSRQSLIRKTTYEGELIYITRHLIPYFSEACPELEDLSPLVIKRYVTYKLSGGRCDAKRGGLSLVSVKKHLAVLRQALDEAVIFGYLLSNPAAPIRLPKNKRPVTDRTVFLNVDEAQKLLDGIVSHPIYPAILIALLYGLRRSEVLGLKWSAVDFERETISVQFTVVKNLSITEADTTKTDGSRRTFQLLPEVKDVLMQLRSVSTPDRDYIFCRSDGRVWRPDTLLKQFQRQLARLGLPKMRFQDLRHSTASLLFDRGWSIEDVKQWLGHADIETTSNIYLHYKASRKVLMAKDLHGLFQVPKKE